MLAPKNKRDFYRIIPFGFIWLTWALIYLLLEKGLLHDLNFYPSTGNPYKFGANTVITLLVAGISGLLMGTFEIKVLNNLFIRHTFGKKIIYKTLIYVLLMITFLTAVSVIGYSVKLRISIFDPQIWTNMLTFLSSFTFWSFQLYLSAGIGVSLFYSEVSENIGLSVLHNFFIGK